MTTRAIWTMLRVEEMIDGRKKGGDVRFESKTAIVTGAGGGIGEAYARALHGEGANVCLLYTSAAADE